jgi:uncharacterized protein (DUF58 family)
VRQVKITREGKRFLIASFLIAVAAANTGNNLIYLMFSLMLSFLLLSVVLLKVNLSGLSLDVSHEAPLFAAEGAFLTVLIKNSKRHVSSYSVHCIVPGAPSPAYFGRIIPLGNEEKGAPVQFRRRGLYRYGDFQLRSGFPFVLLSGTREIPVTGEVLVYPALRDVAGLAGTGGSEIAEFFRLSDSVDDMHSLREFRYGDDWRKIHWKASAHTGELYVKEYAEYGSAKVTVVLDNLFPEGGDLFEKAVSLTASFSKYFIEKGCFVRVVSSRKIISFGKGEEHLFKILDILAVIREEESWDSPVQDPREGFFLTILKSGQRPNPYAAMGEVRYAEDI